jgi:hypothetical protein
MKGLYARGKSLNTRYTYNFSYQNGGRPMTTSDTSQRSFVNQMTEHQVNQELLRYLEANPLLQKHQNLMKKLVPLKYKEVLRE